MAAGEFGPGGSHSSLSLRFDILVFKNLPHCPRRRFRCSFELGGAKLIRGEHFIFRAVHWIFSRRRLMLCSRFWGLKLTSASSLVLARLQSAGKQKSKVVAMEPQPKVQKLDHHNAKVVQVASQALRVKKLAAEAILPSRGSALAAGYDLSSAYDTKVPARGKALVKTELSIAIPEGTYARVAPRSGLAWKNSIDVGAGVIDADYRGPVGVILFNHSDSDFPIKAGDRIAQLILELIVTPDVMEVEDLDATVRGEGGFGSTGVSLVVET